MYLPRLQRVAAVHQQQFIVKIFFHNFSIIIGLPSLRSAGAFFHLLLDISYIYRDNVLISKNAEGRLS